MAKVATALSNAAYGLAMNVLFHPRLSPRAMRRNFELFAATPRARIQRRFPGVHFADLEIGTLRAESLSAAADPARLLLYLHGGGYIFGSIATYRRRALKLAWRCRARVLIPEYRLAPEFPFPAALDDALAAWRRMTADAGGRVALVAGDSAGGGLALALIAALRAAGEPLPAGAVLLSPWTDLGISGASVAANRRRDCWIKASQLADWADMYRGVRPAVDPRISPLYEELSGFPPLLFLTGDQEILLDDTLRLAARARAAGVDVREHIGRGMQHDWPLTLPWLPESRRAWKAIEGFVDEISAARGPG